MLDKFHHAFRHTPPADLQFIKQYALASLRQGYVLSNPQMYWVSPPLGLWGQGGRRGHIGCESWECQQSCLLDA